jgi:GT2 family glycosyltransferase
MQPDWTDPCSLRYIHESQPGLSYVRNRGMDESRGQIVGFLDDDIFISKNWLVDVIDCFNSTGADCVGARTVVHWDGEPEATVRACQDQLVDNATDTGRFEVRGDWLPGGGNMAIRRSVIEEGFRFDHGLGRVGTVLLSGEDTEAMRRMRDSGKRIWFCGSAVMRHRTGGERLKASYYIRRAYWLGLSYALVDRRLRGKAYQVASAIARLVKLAWVTSPAWLLARLRRDAARQLLLRVSMARQCGYIHVTIRAGKLLGQALPK